MKLYLFILSVLLFSCIEQLEREDSNVAELVAYINTYGEAMDSDLTENKMVVAANYHGFIVYDVNRDSMGNIASIDSIYNDSTLDDSMGDNRAQEVAISKNHDIAFITDIYDRIWLYKLDQSATQYVDSYLQDCYGGTWLSTAIDDESNTNLINVFSLVKHSSSESDDEGTVGDFDEYSTSIVWKGLYDINSGDLFPEQSASPSCEFSYNFGILPEKISYNDGLLVVSNGELGVSILKQLTESSCFDSNSNEILNDFISSGNVDNDRIACENPTFDYYNPGLGGVFEPVGGFYPYVYASYDLPGEVNSVYVKDLVVFSGLSTSNGCYISLLGNNGDIIDLQNPSSMPDPTQISKIEEPWIKATIITPDEYLGSIIKICQDKRGIQTNLNYSGNRAVLSYDLPLNEVVFDFNDRLKSVSSGYASFDYEITGHKEGDLVKLGILVNTEPVDALAMIIHKDFAQRTGRQVCEKLKDLIPRHNFMIPVQAAIGGKIIARESIKGFSKDVLTKIHGGGAADRKKKLLKKQKKGKARSKQFGRVEIPQEAFIGVLKINKEN